MEMAGCVRRIPQFLLPIVQFLLPIVLRLSCRANSWDNLVSMTQANTFYSQFLGQSRLYDTTEARSAVGEEKEGGGGVEGVARFGAATEPQRRRCVCLFFCLVTEPQTL